MSKTETVVTHPYFSTAVMSSGVVEPQVWTNLHGKFQHHQNLFYRHLNKLANILTMKLYLILKTKPDVIDRIKQVEVVLDIQTFYMY